jgi:hypothetical protein
MITMNMPGFTADASLYPASEHYRQRSAGAAVTFGVQAALRIGGVGLNATCGNCTCDAGMCCTATAAGCKCDLCGTVSPGGGVLTTGFLS